MKRQNLNINEVMSLAHIEDRSKLTSVQSVGDWVRIFRTKLRMTQAELAKRSGLTQSHIVKIESGKSDPQVSTLKKIFKAMWCDLSIQPVPIKPVDEFLRGRARSLAQKRLKQTMGTMALEGQAPDADMFRKLVEKKTDEILADPKVKLWDASDE